MKKDHELSLSELANGLSIKDIYGYTSTEFGDPVFKITRIELGNDKILFVEFGGDCPYIADYHEILTLPEEE